MCHGYGVYTPSAKSGSLLRIANCRSHVRRTFIDIEASFAAEAGEVLKLIDELFDERLHAEPVLPAMQRAPSCASSALTGLCGEAWPEHRHETFAYYVGVQSALRCGLRRLGASARGRPGECK